MKPTEAVLQSEFCKAFCKRIAGEYWEDIYNDTWIKLHEKQDQQEIKKTVAWFCSSARNRFLDTARRESKITNQNEYILNIEQEQAEHNPIRTHRKAVTAFLISEGIDEYHEYYKWLLELIILSGGIKEAKIKSELTKTVFYDSLAELRRRLKEYKLKTE